ncbi:unnamed protein product [Schistocephalus solidus]|uniref:Zinc finger and BTB domain-containing protein 14 n=1 Tax=Schistocephalus solidus TaxID=70667 RepID=A0A183T9G6_SCHSO|nr:unnamed protein product [Schistocephalus solidus]
MDNACDPSPPLSVSQEAVCTVKSEAPDPTVTCKKEEPWPANERVENKNTTVSTSGDRTKTSSGRRPFKCELCGSAFTQKAALKRHDDVIHQGIANFVCDQCGYRFTSAVKLRLHVDSVHLDLRKFVCDLCGADFKSKQRLNSHVNAVHEESPALQCEICYSILSSKSSLSRHIASVHAEQVPAECNICFAVLCSKDSLNRHIAAVHEAFSELSCEHCGRVFKELANLRKHQKVVHQGLRPLHCPGCGGGFVSSSALTRHLKRCKSGSLSHCLFFLEISESPLDFFNLKVAAPLQLHLPQLGVDAEDSGPLQDFRVRDPVLPSQLQYSAEAAEMKVIQLPSLVRVDVPGLRSVKECRQDDDVVHLQFGV